MVAGVRSLMAHLHRTWARAAQKPSSRDTMAPPVVKWPTGTRIKTVSIACPNCGSDVPKPLLLTIDFTTSPGSRKQTRVLRCSACGCPFYAEQIPPDYAEDAMLERGRVPFYLQQGAGLSLITRPLAQVRAPAGSVYTEVGCGFGFGIDYARHARNWTGKGIDPGGIARLGQEMLGVSIQRRYVQDTEPALAGTCDVVMASETIEHVVSPIRFVRVLRRMLRPGGTLILTTPDGADIRPETNPGVLIGLLSPGLHLIFQTRETLHRTLLDAGFHHLLINKDGHSLVAFASDRPVDLERDNTVLRAQYRAYLEQRSADFSPEQDLFMAFAGRALQEAISDAAFDQADRVRDQIERACFARFGQSLDGLGGQVADNRGRSLDELARYMPLCLGGLLYADAIRLLASGTPRARLGERFRWAAEAADLLRIALANLALADGMSEEIYWAARAEAVLCSAAAGADDVVAQLASLPPAPDAERASIRREVIAERALVELVNAGHYVLAMKLADVSAFQTRAWADPDATIPRSETERDALFGLAVLDSQSDEISVIERSRGRFNRIRQMLETPDGHGGPEGLFAAAVRGELAALERLGQRDSAAAASGAPSAQANGA
jgi:SAM-dependent methyltransferase